MTLRVKRSIDPPVERPYSTRHKSSIFPTHMNKFLYTLRCDRRFKTRKAGPCAVRLNSLVTTSEKYQFTSVVYPGSIAIRETSCDISVSSGLSWLRHIYRGRQGKIWIRPLTLKSEMQPRDMYMTFCTRFDLQQNWKRLFIAETIESSPWLLSWTCGTWSEGGSKHKYLIMYIVNRCFLSSPLSIRYITLKDLDKCIQLFMIDVFICIVYFKPYSRVGL